MSTQAVMVVLAPEYFGSQLQAAKLVSADAVSVDESAIYRRQTYHNRCRVRTPHGLLWLTVPLKRGGGRKPINEVRIDNSERWLVKHWRSLEFNYRSSPFFEYYEPFFVDLYGTSYTFLHEFTSATTQALISALGLLSLLSPNIQRPAMPGKDGIIGSVRPHLVEALGTYRGEEVTGTDDLQSAQIHELSDGTDQTYVEQPYRQNFPGFEAGTSIVDMLFNLGPNCTDHLRSSYRR